VNSSKLARLHYSRCRRWRPALRADAARAAAQIIPTLRAKPVSPANLPEDLPPSSDEPRDPRHRQHNNQKQMRQRHSPHRRRRLPQIMSHALMIKAKAQRPPRLMKSSRQRLIKIDPLVLRRARQRLFPFKNKQPEFRRDLQPIPRPTLPPEHIAMAVTTRPKHCRAQCRHQHRRANEPAQYTPQS